MYVLIIPYEKLFDYRPTEFISPLPLAFHTLEGGDFFRKCIKFFPIQKNTLSTISVFSINVFYS
jgi:hypothetical protein